MGRTGGRRRGCGSSGPAGCGSGALGSRAGTVRTASRSPGSLRGRTTVAERSRRRTSATGRSGLVPPGDRRGVVEPGERPDRADLNVHAVSGLRMMLATWALTVYGESCSTNAALRAELRLQAG